MPNIEIYTKDYCPYCRSVKTYLASKGIAYTEYEIIEQPEKTAEMLSRSNGGRTVPQIFINDTHVGGASDFFDKLSKGELTELKVAA